MILRDNDYGYFGKGITGYVHYNQSFNDNFGGKNGWGKNRKNNSGCLTAIIMIISFICLILGMILYAL